MTMPVRQEAFQGLAPPGFLLARGRPGAGAGYCRAGCRWVVVQGRGSSCVVFPHRLQRTQDGLSLPSPCSEAVLPAGASGMEQQHQTLGDLVKFPVLTAERSRAHLQAFFLQGPPQREVWAGSLARPARRAAIADEVGHAS